MPSAWNLWLDQQSPPTQTREDRGCRSSEDTLCLVVYVAACLCSCEFHSPNGLGKHPLAHARTGIKRNILTPNS